MYHSKLEFLTVHRFNIFILRKLANYSVSFHYSVSSFALNSFVLFCSAPNIQTYTTPHTDIIVIHVHYMGILYTCSQKH